MPKTVAVIGAGVSGLAALRYSVLNGFDVVCYERDEDVGGLWRFREHFNGVSVMQNTILNTSKEMTAYSDFPPSENSPNYMPNEKYAGYLNDYAEHHGLTERIQFNTKVLNIERTPDYQKTGSWTVTIKDIYDKVSSKVFDGVIVCTGRNAKPSVPSIPGQDIFRNTISHAAHYRNDKDYEAKRVVVVGVGNSGCDIAVDLCRTAEKVYLSNSNGAWVYKRLSDYGYPNDLAKTTRFGMVMSKLLPLWFRNMQAREALNRRFDHEVYGLLPKRNPVGSFPTINDDLDTRLSEGQIRIVPEIKAFTEEGVRFIDGSQLENIDEVIFATGYLADFTVVEDGQVITVDSEGEDQLYLRMFPMTLEHDSLIVVGLAAINSGSEPPMLEMQARLAADVLAGHVQLPSLDQRRKEYREEGAFHGRGVFSTRHKYFVAFHSYMEKLAEMMGCRPNLWQLAKSDPSLACAVFFGPANGYQYRLCGRHRWDGARSAILGLHERVLRHTNRALVPKACLRSGHLSVLVQMFLCFSASAIFIGAVLVGLMR